MGYSIFIIFFSLMILWTRKFISNSVSILLLLCLQIQGWPAAPFLLCGSSHQPHYTRQTWLPGSRSRIVVVSCCDVAHRRNGHGLACTGCHPSARRTSRRPDPRPRPGGQISTRPPSITYNNTGKNPCCAEETGKIL